MKQSVLLLLASMLLLSGCSTGRVIEAPYADVKAALRERFDRNEWTERSTLKSSLREKRGQSLKIVYYEWQFPDVKVKCHFDVSNRQGGTKVSVFVRDHQSWWAPFVHRPSWSEAILDALEERIRGGRWRRMPWGGNLVREENPRYLEGPDPMLDLKYDESGSFY